MSGGLRSAYDIVGAICSSTNCFLSAHDVPGMYTLRHQHARCVCASLQHKQLKVTHHHLPCRFDERFFAPLIVPFYFTPPSSSSVRYDGPCCTSILQHSTGSPVSQGGNALHDLPPLSRLPSCTERSSGYSSHYVTLKTCQLPVISQGKHVLCSQVVYPIIRAVTPRTRCEVSPRDCTSTRPFFTR